MNTPLLIVLSCTRNYGWVTRAFLEGNSRWADYIIIVDQMSTDGTREMCAEYGDKVILVDDPDMNYKESTRAKMAFEKGREIAGVRDHIFFALDIDEVMPANWMQTGDGQRILNSQPGDEFALQWANLNPDNKTYFDDGYINPWSVPYKVFHDEPSKVFEIDSSCQMHVPLLPYMNWDIPPYVVKDFLLLHFGHYYTQWNIYKGVFYQFLDIRQHRSKSLVQLYRTYHHSSTETSKSALVKQEWLFDDFDIYQLIDTTTTPIFVEYIREIIAQDGIVKYAKLDVWTPELCQLLNVNNPQTWYHRLFGRYIHFTAPYSKAYVLRIMDKILKFLLR